jgi:serine/threonine protein kinase
VVHRDLKPENIMRRQLKGGGSRLVLIDFGVSKQLSQTVIATSMGTQIGSPGYAPLEQMQCGEACAAGDLYSLGATCLHLLTKNHPYYLIPLRLGLSKY